MLFNNTANDMIQFTIEDRTGERQALEIPEGIGLNLMEVLKAS